MSDAVFELIEVNKRLATLVDELFTLLAQHISADEAEEIYKKVEKELNA